MCILIDLSGAFDTVDHGILLEALNKLKLGGRVFEWFWSYFSGRCQRISVRGCQSKSFNENCGVPQGFFLGPLLFTIHTSSLRDVVQDYLPSIHCYGDDTKFMSHLVLQMRQAIRLLLLRPRYKYRKKCSKFLSRNSHKIPKFLKKSSKFLRNIIFF